MSGIGSATDQYSVQEPTVIYEGGSVIFGGDAPVFKLWHTCGWYNGNVCYAESTDGINFSRYNAGQPVILGIGRPFVIHIGKTYYAYVTAESGGQGWDLYESSDGVNWELTVKQVLPIGSAPWEQEWAGNIFIWTENSTWYSIYEAFGADKHWRVGLATSPDGISWTKYAKNPVISFPFCGGPEIHKIGGVYYMWGQCFQSQSSRDASDIYRLSSTDLLTWTPDLIELQRQTYDEGSNDNYTAQVADPSMVEVNGKVYMFYDATRTQIPSATDAIHLKVAVANMDFATLVASPVSNPK
jgi:sucrose-6-phosphate hydrolase SacC (GH32 family)